MEAVIQYVFRSFFDALGQLMDVFGWTFLLAGALWLTSQGLRGIGAKWLGMGYFWLVAPGVACHETGHALGCLLTGAKVLKFVPFRPSRDGTLGWVEHTTSPTWWGRAREFVIATGPVWFGGLAMLGLMWLLTGEGPSETFGTAAGGADYFASVRDGALAMAGRAFSPQAWHGPLGWLGILLVYLLVCVASEVTLSGSDFQGMVVGLVAIVWGVLVANFVPVADALLAGAVEWLRGPLYYLHSMLAFALAVSAGLFGVALLADWALSAALRGKERGGD